jgi:hypothetical protein
VNKAEMAHYLDESGRVEGWLFSIDAAIFRTVDEVRRCANTVGNLFEISMHHEKMRGRLRRSLQR